MRLRRPLVLTLCALASAAIAGCGDSRTAAPDTSVIQPSAGVQAVTYLSDRLHFKAPSNWARATGTAPLVVTLGSGPALIAIWRYRRSSSEQLPSDPALLAQAESTLTGAAAARDPTFRIISSAVVHVNTLAGIELDALETIRGHVRRVRSTHLFDGHIELVVDEYAPENLFHAVDREVFSPLLHSVRLIG